MTDETAPDNRPQQLLHEQVRIGSWVTDGENRLFLKISDTTYFDVAAGASVSISEHARRVLLTPLDVEVIAIVPASVHAEPKTEPTTPNWIGGDAAKKLPVGCTVLVRRVIQGGIHYSVDTYFRPDWVDGDLARPGKWDWALIELPPKDPSCSCQS